MASIIVDDRERAVVGFLETQSEKYHIDYKIQHMNVGDYAVVYQGYVLMIIERKTWIDLSASMRDGRKENVNKLIKLREMTGCKILYLIEGNATPLPDKKYGRIPASQLRSHLDHLMLRDNIFVIHSVDQQDTARRLFELVKNHSTIKPSPFKFVKDSDEKINVNILTDAGNEVDKKLDEDVDKKLDEDVDKTTHKKQPNVINDQVDKKESTQQSKQTDLLHSMQCMMVTETSQQEQFLKCFPSVGSIVSVVLAQAGVTVKKIALNQVTADFIANLKYDTGSCIGLKKAQTICGYSVMMASISQNGKKLCAKMAQAVKGISKKTATVIGNTYTLIDLIQGKILASELANISKGKTKLGLKIANDLLIKLST